MWLCAAGSCLTVAYVTIGSGFLPLFYVKVRQFSPQQMSTLMSVLGISSLALGVVLPAISDRIGRKPLAIVASIADMVCPLAAIYYSGPAAVLTLLAGRADCRLQLSTHYRVALHAAGIGAGPDDIRCT